ncbi:MAG: adenine-specific DNA methylase [Candidatus Odinarchaeia archaeon]
MPNTETFNIKPIRELILKYQNPFDVWVDPFARNSNLATFTNDINPATTAQSHLDAFEFLQCMFNDETIDGILIDPPFSVNQVVRNYQGYGTKRVQGMTVIRDQTKRILRKGGYAICCGWNSNGIGKTRGFKLIELLVVSHGGSHNDTLVTVEIKL